MCWESHILWPYWLQYHGLNAMLLSLNKQLLDEVEHDIVNYQNRGLCDLPKSKAQADNTDTISCENRIQ